MRSRGCRGPRQANFHGHLLNLEKIVSEPVLGLTGRALEVLVFLGAVMAVFTLLLLPGQALWLMGAEIMALGFADRAWVSTI